MLSPFKMCSTSLHLLIGALLVIAVENEVTTMIDSKETTTALVSMSNDNTNISDQTSVDFPNNLTSFPPHSNVTPINMTDENMSDLPTPPPSDHPQTNNVTTDDSQENVPKSSTNHPQTNTVVTEDPRKNVPKSRTTTQAKTEKEKSNGLTYIIILIIVVVCISGVVVYCCLQKNSRRYSVDLHPKQEDAHIPLSTVDAEVFDTTSDKESADVKQENQQNLSSTQATVIPKDKTAELTVVDMTDGEPTISTKTSMESLDDVLNENNSNNSRTKDI
ncbi:uncharacterized protein si:dkey-27h10.2 isoform X2 [Chanodichthys erythropterus]|uniref:uncharacterized protein si:dkey-27h10.2 isoform X2 n=1 Tax=Chanodichthys erythropterus TaxID=933992 RepID=UPI00351E1937